jgi:hypothetical protein
VRRTGAAWYAAPMNGNNGPPYPPPGPYPQAPAYPAPGAQQPQGAQSWAGPPVVQGPSGYGVRAIGLFDPIPCPHCGAPTHNASGATVRYAGGLLGVLLHGAIVARYTCMTHGEIPKNAFPPQHASSIDMRRLLKLAGALVCIGLLFFLLLLRVML